MGATQSYDMTVVPGLGSGEADKVEIKAAITGLTNGYGWLYFKLVGDGGPRVLNNGTTWTGGGTAVPQAANWDILATRTNELQTEDGTTVSAQMPVASRSSVLLNTYKTVKAKVVTGKLIDEVPDTALSDDGLSGEIDAIGYSWYSMAGMPPTFSVAGNTYIIKTVESKFAKFQPESFYGPNNESFVMDFSYEYDGSGINPPTGAEDKEDEEEEEETNDDYVDKITTLNVDYSGVNNAVFFDFSTGTRTVLPHDFFDIAIDSGGNIIANSGSYGSGVQVYMTAESSIAADFSASPGATAVKEYTFKTGESLYNYQTAENPLGKLGMTASKVALIKVQHKTTDAAVYFKVVFSMTMTAQEQSFNVTVVPGLGSGEAGKKEIKAAITGITKGYGWLYFKLVGDGGPRVLNNGTTWTGGGKAAPQATDWDILATRTNELQSTDGTTVSTQMPMASRSSVLLNTYKTVQAKVVTGKSIDEVTATDLSDEGLSGEIDAIGYGWYSTGTGGGAPTYSVPINTYVIKTVEGGFAKFQPKTFTKDSKSFVMDFDYSYKSGE
jgi:hypothetical protein